LTFDARDLSIHATMPISTRSGPPAYLVRSGAFEGFVPLVASLGVDAHDLLLEAGVDPAALDDPETRILSLAFRRAMHLAARRSGVEHFGLLLAQRQHLSTIGPLGAAVAGARDVRHGIELVNGFLQLHTEGTFARLEIHGVTAVWASGLLLPEEPGGRQAEDHVVAFGVRMLRRLTRTDWSPDFVTLTRVTPRDVAPYRKFFDCDVLFGAEVAQIGFGVDVLARKNSTADWHVQAVLDRYLRELAASKRGRSDTQLDQILAQSVMRGDCSLRSVAKSLGMSARSLQRRLSAEGRSFQAELDRVRSGIAARYLEEGQVPLTVLADMLGYSDLASFSRAFKRTRGDSPLAWRRRHRQSV